MTYDLAVQGVQLSSPTIRTSLEALLISWSTHWNVPRPLARDLYWRSATDIQTAFAMTEACAWESVVDEEPTGWEVVNSPTSGQTEHDEDSSVTDAWEVITSPVLSASGAEMAKQKLTERYAPSPFAMVNDGCQRPQTLQKPRKAKQNLAQHARCDDLHPCKSCKGYHYVTQCIYTLSWTEWLDYHLTYMPSQPYGHSPEGLLLEDTADLQTLYYRAEELDKTSEGCEVDINYLSETRLKADLMTKSGVEIFLDDEKWQRRLQGIEGGLGGMSVEDSQIENFDLEDGRNAHNALMNESTEGLPTIAMTAEGCGQR